MSILDLLRSDGSIVVNKSLAHRVGLNETIILSELISLFLFYRDKQRLDEDGYFYCTVETLEENTTLKKDAQNKAIVKLGELGLIRSVKKGLPAKRHVTIDEAAIAAFILSADKTAKKPPTDNGAEIQPENPEKDRSNQSAKKPPTRQRENSEQVGEKTSINNTYNNTDLKQEEEEETTTTRADMYSAYEDVFHEMLKRGELTFADRDFLSECFTWKLEPRIAYRVYCRVAERIRQVHPRAIMKTFDVFIPNHLKPDYVSNPPAYFAEILENMDGLAHVEDTGRRRPAT